MTVFIQLPHSKQVVVTPLPISGRVCFLVFPVVHVDVGLGGFFTNLKTHRSCAGQVMRGDVCESLGCSLDDTIPSAIRQSHRIQGGGPVSIGDGDKPLPAQARWYDAWDFHVSLENYDCFGELDHPFEFSCAAKMRATKG